MAGSSGGLRSLLNGNPFVSGGAVVVLVAIAVAVWMYTHPAVSHGNFYYTDDDGKTYFTGPVRVTPYTSGGKEVVEAHVFKCGEKTFVGFLRRYPENVRAQVAAQLKLEQPGRLPPSEVKRPGDANWVMEGSIPGVGSLTPGAAGTVSAQEIEKPTCEDGKFAVPVQAPQ